MDILDTELDYDEFESSSCFDSLPLNRLPPTDNTNPPQAHLVIPALSTINTQQDSPRVKIEMSDEDFSSIDNSLNINIQPNRSAQKLNHIRYPSGRDQMTNGHAARYCSARPQHTRRSTHQPPDEAAGHMSRRRLSNSGERVPPDVARCDWPRSHPQPPPSRAMAYPTRQLREQLKPVIYYSEDSDGRQSSGSHRPVAEDLGWHEVNRYGGAPVARNSSGQCGHVPRLRPPPRRPQAGHANNKRRFFLDFHGLPDCHSNERNGYSPSRSPLPPPPPSRSSTRGHAVSRRTGSEHLQGMAEYRAEYEIDRPAFEARRQATSRVKRLRHFVMNAPSNTAQSVPRYVSPMLRDTQPAQPAQPPTDRIAGRVFKIVKDEFGQPVAKYEIDPVSGSILRQHPIVDSPISRLYN